LFHIFEPFLGLCNFRVEFEVGPVLPVFLMAGAGSAAGPGLAVPWTFVEFCVELYGIDFFMEFDL
jgi:hypothetical protein